MSNIHKKLSNMSLEFNATKKTSNKLKFAYFATDDIKSIAVSLFNKYGLTFKANQLKCKIKNHTLLTKKNYSGAHVKFKYSLIDNETGEVEDFIWHGYATDYGDGGRVSSKAASNCLKNWLLTLFLVNEKQPMTQTEFYQYLENNGIDKGGFKKAMLILGRRKLKISELEIVFNEVLAIKDLIDRFEIQSNTTIKEDWYKLSDSLGIESHKIARYMLESSGYDYYIWPHPSLGGRDKRPSIEEIQKFYNSNGH